MNQFKIQHLDRD